MVGDDNVVTRSIPILSICSGTGALDAGIKLALPRVRTICYVENDVTACATLVKGIKNAWLDDAPIWDDIKTFNATPWRGHISAIIGGYPCQPFSNAGKRAGVSDVRHLWPYVEALITKLKPDFCFFENVEAHLSYGYFDVVKPSLEARGYAVTQGLFTASEAGAPHLRRRLYILAYASKSRLERWPFKEMASTRTLNTSTRRVRWDSEPNISRVDDGTPYRRDRIHQSGNAVIPVVAAKAFCTLAYQLVGGVLDA